MAEEPSDLADVSDEGRSERFEGSSSTSASERIEPADEPVDEQDEQSDKPEEQGGGVPEPTHTVAAVPEDGARPPAVPTSHDDGAGPPSAAVEPPSSATPATSAPTPVDTRAAAVDDFSTPELNGSGAPDGAPEVSEPEVSEPEVSEPEVAEPEVAGRAEVVQDDLDPGEQAGPDPLVVALEALTRMERRLDEMVRLGERNADHAGSLHAENQRLRAGEISMAIAPMMRDVIRVHDDIVRLEGSCAPESTEDLMLVRELLVGLLERWGVRPFDPLRGDTFDVAEHNGLARVETTDALDGKVAAVRRCGFRSDEGRILRPADVEVFRQVSPPADVPIVEGE